MNDQTCIVIGNEGDADAGVVGEALRAYGFALQTLARETHPQWPAADWTSTELVLVLGSAWSVHWPKLYREVAAERSLLVQAHDAGVPIFGICYGAQMLSHALGGAVRVSPHTEIGWYDIDLADAAPSWFSSGPWFQWHSDTFSLPVGATALGHTRAGIQGFVSGRSFATQFHPEVTAEIVDGWVAVERSALEAGGVSPEVLEGAGPWGDSSKRAVALLDGFLSDIANSAR